MLSGLSLACLTSETVVRVVPKDPQTADVHLTVSMYLTEAYIAAAKLANIEMAQDFRSAGLAPPEVMLPESWQDLNQSGGSVEIPGNGRIVEENERGFTAEGVLPYIEGQEPDPDQGWTLTTIRDDPAWVVYRLEVKVETLSGQFTMADWDQLRQEGLPPKPPIETDDEEDGSGGLLDLSFLYDDAEKLSLPGWYAQRVLLASGLPETTYVVELPGEVLLHELDGQPAGEYDPAAGRVSLKVDEAFMRQYSGAEYTFRVESRLSTCELTCSAHPNMIWDGEGDGTYCSCICAQGWQSDDQGVCVACDQMCPAWDARSQYDPQNNQPNSCACRCSGALIEWDFGQDRCRCVTGSEPVGDECRCLEGTEPDSRGTGCVSKEPTEPAPPGECQPGKNCLNDPADCSCPAGQVCDPFSDLKDAATLCSPRVAYVFISDEVTAYETYWILFKINHIRRFFREQGYVVQTIMVSDFDDMSLRLGGPAAGAMAFFGHASQPSLEGLDSVGVGNRLFADLQIAYGAAGLDRERARQLANERSRNLNLDYAYVHTCHSLDNTSLRDRLVKPGGTYWGEEGLLFPTQWLSESRRP
jgi:hypothetical protein